MGLQRHGRGRIPISGAPPYLRSGQKGIRRCRVWAGFPLRLLPLGLHSMRVIERRGEWVHQWALVRGIRFLSQFGVQGSAWTGGEVIVRVRVHLRSFVVGKRRWGGLPRGELSLEPNGRNTRWGRNAPRHFLRYWPLVTIVKGRCEMACRTINNNGFPLSFDLLEIIRRGENIRFGVQVPHSQWGGLRFATSLTSVAVASTQPRESRSSRGNGPSGLWCILFMFRGGDLNRGKVRGLQSRSAAGVYGQIGW